MDSDLKRIIDTNHPEWDTLSVEQAVGVVGHIVTEVSNPVVYRKWFDQILQKRDETIQEFVTNLRMCAMDCAFVCPFDQSHELTDYHIVNRNKVIFLEIKYFSENKGSTVFQNFLLSVSSLGSRLLQKAFFSLRTSLVQKLGKRL